MIEAGRPVRAVRLGPEGAVFDRRPDGSTLVRSTAPLPDYPERITERLEYWAACAPDRVFLARRDETGRWCALTYAETLRGVRRVAQSLIGRNLSPERPIAILSGNDFEHALLALAALYIGVPYAPISPSYSLLSEDYGKLRHAIGLLTPGLVFAADGDRYGRAISAALRPDSAALKLDSEIVVTHSPDSLRDATLFSELLEGNPISLEGNQTSLERNRTSEVDSAHVRVGPETVAKILFTSGSTGLPKGVINTQRMLCSNQAMIGAAMAFMQDEPPVIVDWLPWHHTFGGNHNIGLVLYNGGSLYIDEGRPLPGAMEQSVRNLSEIAPTVYFNVPKGYEMLVGFLRRDAELRRNFFSRLKLLFYAAASLPQHVWGALEDLALETCGERIAMITGLGATESAPSALFCTRPVSRAGVVGLPAPGVELKLVPRLGKLEARLRGPNVTPGYWREPELTRDAFDDEGFYCIGDALRWLDPAVPERGLVFDGRIAEDFKLATGTWVSVGPLRAQFIAHFAPYVRDVVIAGHDRDELTALIVPDADACRALSNKTISGSEQIEIISGSDPIEVLNHQNVRAVFAARLTELAERSTGSTNRIVRAIILTEQLSLDLNEVTDKGSINQRAVLDNRAALIEDLYSSTPTARVICIDENAPGEKTP